MYWREEGGGRELSVAPARISVEGVSAKRRRPASCSTAVVWSSSSRCTCYRVVFVKQIAVSQAVGVGAGGGSIRVTACAAHLCLGRCSFGFSRQLNGFVPGKSERPSVESPSPRETMLTWWMRDGGAGRGSTSGGGGCLLELSGKQIEQKEPSPSEWQSEGSLTRKRGRRRGGGQAGLLLAALIPSPRTSLSRHSSTTLYSLKRCSWFPLHQTTRTLPRFRLLCLHNSGGT
jgi:hypothetical protein